MQGWCDIPSFFKNALATSGVGVLDANAMATPLSLYVHSRTRVTNGIEKGTLLQVQQKGKGVHIYLLQSFQDTPGLWE